VQITVGSISSTWQQLVEQLARAPHERDALEVLLGARRLADEHQVGVGVAGAEDRLGARGVQRAALAAAHLAVEIDELLAALLGRRHRRLA
jgi:hypothetical protein